MRSFKRWLSERTYSEGSGDDVRAICMELAGGKNLLLNWQYLAEVMRNVGNDLKADYIERFIQRNSSEYWRNQPPTEISDPLDGLRNDDRRAANNMINRGIEGFCTPDGQMRDPSGVTTRPSITARVMAGPPSSEAGAVARCLIPFTESTINGAKSRQMGLSQYVGDGLRSDMLSFQEAAFNYPTGRRPLGPNRDLLLNSVREAIDGKHPGVVSVNENPFYVHVNNDIENYPMMLLRI